VALKIRHQCVGKWRENSYILEYNGQSILIDPGDDFENLDKKFQENGSRHIAIINTHGHFDHIGAVQAFKAKYNIPFYLHSKDRRILTQANMIRKFAEDTEYVQIPAIDYFLDTIISFDLSDKKIVFHHTPGHSHGSVCIEIDNNLFSGDILFEDSIGRTDLPGGNRELLINSVKFIIERFKGYNLFPGHKVPFILDGEVIKRIQKLI
jgi:glyoxylase-like metal-dependent hydrolase (beta-lactamase superfamily II)